MTERNRLGFIVLLIFLATSAAFAAEPGGVLSVPAAPSADASLEAIFGPAGCEGEPERATPALSGEGVRPAQFLSDGFCCVYCDGMATCGTPTACCINRHSPLEKRCCMASS